MTENNLDKWCYRFFEDIADITLFLNMHDIKQFHVICHDPYKAYYLIYYGQFYGE